MAGTGFSAVALTEGCVQLQLAVVPPLPLTPPPRVQLTDASAAPARPGRVRVSARAAIPEPQRSAGPVDENTRSSAGEDEVGHLGPRMLHAVPLPESQGRVQQAALGARQVQVLTGQR